jgi:hypothetical protein
MLETIRRPTTSTSGPVPTVAEVEWAPVGLNAAVRSLFGRKAPVIPSPLAPSPAWETSDEAAPDDFDIDAGQAPVPSARYRAEAHAAFRAVDGSPVPAVDAALDVMEAEMARLRASVLAYGEALKAIAVYGADARTRKTAAVALRRAPERLRTALPAPRHG